MKLYEQHKTVHKLISPQICLNMCYKVRHGVTSGQILRHYLRICPGSTDKTQKTQFSIADGPFSCQSKHIMKNPILFSLSFYVFFFLYYYSESLIKYQP